MRQLTRSRKIALPNLVGQKFWIGSGGGVAAPIAAGGIADQFYPEDIAITPLNVALDFTGTGITYALAPSSAALPVGLSLSSAGLLTGTSTTPAAAATIVVRGTNAGGFADTAFDVTVTVAGATIPTVNQTTATHGGITIDLGGTYPVGTYADGFGVFIVAPGGITAASQTPSYTTSPRAMFGGMKNPTGENADGFDIYMGATSWNAGLVATYPLTLAAKDVLSVCNSRASPTNEDRDGIPLNYGNFVVVDAAPVVDTLTPPLHWPTPATRPMALVAPISTITAALTRRSSTGLGIPSWATAKVNVGRAAPFYSMLSAASNGGYQSMLPFEFGLYGSGQNYGEGVCKTLDRPILGAILTDAYNTADQREAILTLLGHGVQWAWGFYGHGYGRGPDGGHHQWAQFPMLFAGHFLDTTVRDYVIANVLANYKHGIRMTAQVMNDIWNPHTSGGKNMLGRVRTAGAGTVAGTIFMQEFITDSENWRPEGTVMRRLSDGASAIVTGSLTMDGGSGTYQSNTYSGATFAPGDQHTLEPPYTVDIGDYFFSTTGNMNFFTASPSTSYITLQRWTAGLAGILVAGIPTTALKNAINYMLRANTTNEPAGYDFPSMLGEPEVTNYFNTWGSTVFAAYYAAPADTTAPVLSAFSAVQTSSTTAMITVTTDEANGGLFYVLTNSATAPTALQIRQRKNHLGAAALKFGSRNITTTGVQKLAISGLSPSTLYHCHAVHTDMDKNSSTIQSTSFTTAATGTVYIEDWNGLVVGNTYSEVNVQNGGYTRSAATATALVVVAAENPNGVAVQFQGTGTHRWMDWDAVSSALAGLTTTRRQALVLVRLNNVAGGRAGWGYGVTNLVTGAGFRQSGGVWSVDLRDGVDPNVVVTAGTNGQNLLTGLANGSLVWVRVEVEGDTMRGRAWAYGGSEPGTWSTITKTPGTNVVFDKCGFQHRTGTACFDVVAHSIGIAVDAPIVI